MGPGKPVQPAPRLPDVEIEFRIERQVRRIWCRCRWSWRGAFDFPVLGVAAWVDLDAQGLVRAARIVVGAVGSWPMESEEAAKVLIGQPLTDESITAAATAAARRAKPLDNTDFTIGWRKDMVPVYARRALVSLLRPLSPSDAAGLPPAG
jgi:CO/xanthine dehydrogenase FAD-binding subunit